VKLTKEKDPRRKVSLIYKESKYILTISKMKGLSFGDILRFFMKNY